jgi:hypothetical protein
MTLKEFDGLLPLFAQKWDSYIRKFTLSGKPRTRRYSPKGDFDMSEENLLFFIMVYLKNNNLQETHAAMFDMKQDMCNKLIHILHPIVNKSLEQYRPETNGSRLDYVIQKNEYLAGDCTERKVQRDSYCQEEYYSGKKNFTH